MFEFPKMNQENKVTIYCAIGILALWAISGFILYGYQERGTFGDMFGAINSLFSGFAFLGVIYAILLQRNELKLQREELELTRNELKKAADAQEKSEKALAQQAKAMEKTAIITSLTATLESYERRLSLINKPKKSGNPGSDREDAIKADPLKAQIRRINARLDQLTEEALTQ